MPPASSSARRRSRAISPIGAGPVVGELAELGEAVRAYAYIGVPLRVRGRVAGVMSFGTTDDQSQREYSDADLVMVEEFARRVSVAVENARLFRQAEELNRLK